MSVHWDGDDYMAGLKAQLAINLEKAAIYLKGRVKEELNRSQPYERYVGENGVYYRGLDPSLPGEPPKKITGFLQRSIAHEMRNEFAGPRAFVGTGVEYGLFLEIGTVKMLPRPFLRSTLDKEQATIAKIIQTGKA